MLVGKKGLIFWGVCDGGNARLAQVAPDTAVVGDGAELETGDAHGTGFLCADDGQGAVEALEQGQDARGVHGVASDAEGEAAVGGAAPLGTRGLGGAADGTDASAWVAGSCGGGREDGEVWGWGVGVGRVVLVKVLLRGVLVGSI